MKIDEKLKTEFENNELEKKILEHSSNFEVPVNRSKEEVWLELSAKIEGKENKSAQKNSAVFYKIAAAIVVLISLSFYFIFQDTTIKTGFAQNKQIVLPDGSTVILQAGSEIAYNKFSWDKNRVVNLSGEAFFSVKKGKRFQVISENGTVQVLGTKFNVISRNQNFKVACVTGKVSVTLKDKTDAKILTKGLFTEKLAENILSVPSKIDVKIITARQKGRFAFDKTPLSDVFEEIERQFDVEIQYNGNKERLFTGYFSNKELDKALQMVCIPMELQYTIKDKLVVLTDAANQ